MNSKQSKKSILNTIISFVLSIILAISLIFLAYVTTSILYNLFENSCNPINYICANPAPGWRIEKNQYGQYKCSTVMVGGLVRDSPPRFFLRDAIADSWDIYSRQLKQSRLEDSKWEIIKK